MSNMTKRGSQPSIRDLATRVDNYYERPRHLGYFLWLIGFVVIFAALLVLITQMISLGFQTGELGVGDTIISIIALLALLISISQFTGGTNDVDNDEWVANCIQHNLKRITKKHDDMTDKHKLMLSALIKMKTRNEAAQMVEVIQHLSHDPEIWVAFLYELGDGSSLLQTSS